MSAERPVVYVWGNVATGTGFYDVAYFLARYRNGPAAGGVETDRVLQAALQRLFSDLRDHEVESVFELV